MMIWRRPIKEAREIEKEVDILKYPDRVDLRDLNFCTIDPVTAKDFDDAIYFDEKKLYFICSNCTHSECLCAIF